MLRHWKLRGLALFMQIPLASSALAQCEGCITGDWELLGVWGFSWRILAVDPSDVASSQMVYSVSGSLNSAASSVRTGHECGAPSDSDSAGATFDWGDTISQDAVLQEDDAVSTAGGSSSSVELDYLRGHELLDVAAGVLSTEILFGANTSAIASGFTFENSRASGVMRSETTLTLAREGADPYTNQLTFDSEPALSLLATKGHREDECEGPAPGPGSVRLSWQLIVLADTGGGFVKVGGFQGMTAGTSNGVIPIRRGRFASPYTSIDDLSNANKTQHVINSESAMNYSIGLSGEPTSVRVIERLFWLAPVDNPDNPGTLLATGVHDLGDINESGVLRPIDRDLLIALDGVVIDSDPDFEYNPFADLDGDGDIDSDDLDLFDASYCLADFNGDTDVDILDSLDFLDAYGNDDLAADMDENGEIDILDFLLFQDVYGSGC